MTCTTGTPAVTRGFYRGGTMSNINTIIMLMHGDKGATVQALKDAFRADFTLYIKGNASALRDARSNLKNTAKDKAIENALTAGIQAGGRAYYIAPKGVKFDQQSPEDLAMWSSHIEEACTAFNTTIDASEAWDKKTATEKEKQDKANLKAAKREETINAAIAARGLVDPKTIRPFSPDELIGQAINEIEQNNCTKEQLKELYKVTMAALAILHKAEQLALARANMKAITNNTSNQI